MAGGAVPQAQTDYSHNALQRPHISDEATSLLRMHGQMGRQARAEAASPPQSVPAQGAGSAGRPACPHRGFRGGQDQLLPHWGSAESRLPEVGLAGPVFQFCRHLTSILELHRLV